MNDRPDEWNQHVAANEHRSMGSEGLTLTAALDAVTALESNPLAVCPDCTAHAELESRCIDGGMVRDALRDIAAQPAAGEPFDEADEMCPNCVTPWKCNGPHLSEQTVAAQPAAGDLDVERAVNGVRTWMRQGSHELVARDEVLAALQPASEPQSKNESEVPAHG